MLLRTLQLLADLGWPGWPSSHPMVPAADSGDQRYGAAASGHMMIIIRLHG